MSDEMFVIPWPGYADDGRGPFWRLRIESPAFTGTLSYAQPLGRFTDTHELFQAGRSSPGLLRRARAFMADFFSKAEHQSREVAWHPV